MKSPMEVGHKFLRLAVIGASPCDRCVAACCKQNGHDFAAILRGDEPRKFAAFSQAINIRQSNGALVGEKVLPYRDGRCQFLDGDDRCAIYEDRPAACRAFECSSKLNAYGIGQHDVFLRRNPRVLELLQSM